MTNTKNKTKTLLKGLLGASALTVLSAGSAFAAGTAADTTVSNTFTLDYKVGTVDQPQVTPPTATTFKVDRLVDVDVAAITPAGPAAPGALQQEVRFTVTNNGNDTHAYSLAAFDESGDNFNTTNSTIVFYVDDGDGIFEPGGDDGSPITYDGTSTGSTAGGNVAPDGILHVVIRSDVPITALDGQTADLTLVADSLVTGGAATQIAADTDTTNDIDVTENVLADDSGTARENANEGDHSATNTITVGAALVTGEKLVSIFAQDGTGCATIPGTPATPTTGQYSVPGACVEYRIYARNAGSAVASDIIIADTLPAELEFVGAAITGFGGSAVFNPALPSGGTNCTGGACVVSMTLGQLAGGTVGTPTEGYVTIRATVK